jgi:non-homologous end joining protein Ku
MADAAKRSSTNTTLFIGTLEARIGLYGTNAKPSGLPGDWSTAGPNGGRLKYEMRGAPAAEPVEVAAVVPGSSDPLATAELPRQEAEAYIEARGEAERARDALEAVAPRPSSAGALVPGEFRQVLVEEGSGEVVAPDQVRRGVRLEDGRFIDCTDQLAAIEARTKLDRIEVEKVIDGTRVHRERVLGARYVGAQDADAIAKLGLLYHALRRRREAAVVKYTLRQRQYLGVIVGTKRGLMLLDLVWAEDWRDAPAKALAVVEADVPEEQIEAMSSLLGALHGTVDTLDELRDDAIRLREELLLRAHEGELTEVVTPLPTQPEADSLEDALQASLEAVRSRGGKV